MENSEDLEKPADLDLHCFQNVTFSALALVQKLGKDITEHEAALMSNKT